jgi:hypothetical protein
MQAISSSPQLASQYNLGPMFSYFIKTQGGRITEFEKSQEQIAYEQAMAQWQQMVTQIVDTLKGVEPSQVQELMKSLPPQPTPEQYGYKPGGADPYSAAAPQVENRIYNIQNRIANQEQ